MQTLTSWWQRFRAVGGSGVKEFVLVCTCICQGMTGDDDGGRARKSNKRVQANEERKKEAKVSEKSYPRRVRTMDMFASPYTAGG